MTDARMILEALRSVQEHRTCKASGICHNVAVALRVMFPDQHYEVDDDAWMQSQFKDMGLNVNYPVAPAADYEVHGDHRHMNAYEYTHDLWAGEYGANRMALLDKLIARAKEQVAQEEAC